MLKVIVMIEHVLWAALILLIAASVLPGRYRRHRFLVGAAGWSFFAIHWLIQPVHYFEIGDYFNIILVLVVAFFCMIIAHAMIQNYRHYEDAENILLTITTASALGGMFYYPFAENPILNTFLISMITEQIVYILHALNIPAQLIDWNRIELNGYLITIILACTAIESIAIFIGLIFCVRASVKRTTIAFIASVPVIYMLNLVRNTFVVVANGYQWFGEYSFQIAHHVIAKIGSGIALFVIAYVVLQTLPELLHAIDRLLAVLRRYIIKREEEVR